MRCAPDPSPQTPVLLPLTAIHSARVGRSSRRLAAACVGWVRTPQLGEENAKACKDAAAGKDAALVRESEDGFLEAACTFELGHLTEVDLNTLVPKFVELDYLDKTYGRPYFVENTPELNFAHARWDFSDGGRVEVFETAGSISIYAKTIPPH